MLNNIIRNPRLLVTLIGAVLALLIAAGIDVSPELRDAISGLVLAVIAIVTGATATPNGDVAATTPLFMAYIVSHPALVGSTLQASDITDAQLDAGISESYTWVATR